MIDGFLADGGETVVDVQFSSSRGSTHCGTPSHILPQLPTGTLQGIIPIFVHISAVVAGAGTIWGRAEFLFGISLHVVQAPALH
jgi:hypothetical protein